MNDLRLRTASRATVIALIALMVGCGAPAKGPGDGDRSAGPATGAAPARRALLMAITREPNALEPSLQGMSREWAAIGTAFLSYFSPATQAAEPYLAAELPAIDKGTWKLLPDGRMETT